MRKLFVAVIAASLVSPVLAAQPLNKTVAPLAAGEKKAKALHGAVVKVDGDKLTIKVKDKETVVATDANTKVTIEGKDAKLADLKADQVVTVTPAEGTAQTIVVAAPKKAAK